METFLDNVANESRELRMEDTLPSIQIGLMGILAVYGFVTLFFRLTGASSRSGGDDLFNIFPPKPLMTKVRTSRRHLLGEKRAFHCAWYT